MLARLGAIFSRWAERWVPDPFVLALALTFLAITGGVALSGSLAVTLHGWYSGFSSTPLLAFALQMCLVLVTGHAVAISPPIQRGVRAVARWPKTTPAAAAFVALIACVTGIVHWGLGAVVAAFVVREIATSAAIDRRAVDIPVLGAAAYTGLAVWHGGLSGSGPLKAAEAQSMTGAVAGGAIPVSETLFSSLNYVVTGGLLLLLPLMCFALAPREASIPEEPHAGRPTASTHPGASTGKLPGLLIGGAVAATVVVSWATNAIAFDLNSVNLLFLAIAFAAHGSVRNFLDAITDGARSAGAIIVQFPLYFGILGVMQATDMIQLISGAAANISNATTFPLLSFLSAGLVNFFIPSGGGQWALQSDVLLSTAATLDVAPGRAVMSFAYGDQWTNLLQPFWALPLLGITGLKAREIAGYTALLAIGMAAWVGVALLLFR